MRDITRKINVKMVVRNRATHIQTKYNSYYGDMYLALEDLTKWFEIIEKESLTVTYCIVTYRFCRRSGIDASEFEYRFIKAPSREQIGKMVGTFYNDCAKHLFVKQ